MGEKQTKCFFEELPKDTLVVGTSTFHALKRPILMQKTGHFKTEVANAQTNTYTVDPNVKVLITVDETFDNDHRVVSKRDSDSGRFTFSAADSGQHKICLTPDGSGASTGWLSGGASEAIRMTLDMAIGETSKIEMEDKGKMQDIVQKVKDLNGRLHDIRREQVFQRVRPSLSPDGISDQYSN